MRGIIERFEGDLCIIELEDANFIDIPLEFMPELAKEGDCIFINEQGIYIDEDATKILKDEMQNLMDELFYDK